MASKKIQIKEKIGEQSSQTYARRDRLRWLPGFLVIMLAVFMTLFEQFYFKPVQVPEGQLSLRAIRAPYDFVFDEQKAIEAVIEKQLKEFIPIYRLDSEKSRQIQAKWEEFFSGLNECRDLAGTSSRRARVCLNNLFHTQLGMTAATELLRYPHLNKMRDFLVTSTNELLSKGILQNKEDLKGLTKLRVRLSEDAAPLPRKLSDLQDIPEVIDILSARLELLDIKASLKEALLQKFNQLLEPNLYSVQENEELLAAIREQKSEKKKILYKRGDLLVRSGQVVTYLDTLRIQDCLAKSRPNSIYVWIASFITFSIMTLLFVLIAQRMAWTQRAPAHSYLLLFAVLVFVLFVAKALYLTFNFSGFAMPISAAGIVVALLLDLPAALLAVLLMAIYSTFLTSLSMGLFIYYLISGVFFVLLATRSEKRVKLAFGSFLVGILNVVLLLFILLMRDVFPDEALLKELAPQAFLSAPSAWLLAFLIVPLCEKIFGLTTADRLRELADLNHPLLKKLQEKAPGSYYHCLAVANLASAAAEVVNADIPLIRAGAYYHDIGKILQPEYFIENQDSRENPHDTMDPTTSFEVVKAHVKDGVAIVREYRFPQALIDLIAEHHGTTVVEAIYNRARQRQPDLYCNEDFFRYEGPKPQRVESAILMIADVVEAVGRLQKTTDPLEVKKAIHRVIVKKFDDGQFDRCGLSTELLAQIETSLMQTLLRILHKRIEYPERQQDCLESS